MVIVVMKKSFVMCVLGLVASLAACGAEPEEPVTQEPAQTSTNNARSANNAQTSDNAVSGNNATSNNATAANNATSANNTQPVNNTANNATTPANNQSTPVNNTSVEPEGCGEQEDCIDTFPQVLSDTTSGGAAELSSYSCAPDTNESGPERAYKVILAQPGFLAARIANEPEGVDIDVHILSALDEDSCLDRGHFAAGAYLEPGEYWVVADSWTDDQGMSYAGAFDLELNLVQKGDWALLGMNSEVAADAFDAFTMAWRKGDTKHLAYAITDFSIHSSNERLWIVDLATDTQLYFLTVGHGIGSVEGEDKGEATAFSNVVASHQSSLGMMRAAEPYVGDYGYSMRLDGLEPGYNDNARQRDIVVHPDERNAPEVTAMQGYLTPSRGCPTLDPAISTEVVDLMSEGGLMFFWYPDEDWRSGSSYLR